MAINHIKLHNWQFREVGTEQYYSANIPSTIHTDLYDNDLIPHPYEENNEANLQWIDKKDWEYICEFDVAASWLQEDNIMINFPGLDTYCKVFLNNQLLFEADNMFRSWTYSIKDFLTEGKNEFRLVFESITKKALQKLNESPFPLPAPNDDSIIGGMAQNKVSPFVRKAPYHFGWDWGPRFVTAGIWKMPTIECWSKAKITNRYIEQTTVSASRAELICHLEFESFKSQLINISIQTEDYNWTKMFEVRVGRNVCSLPLIIEQPKLWWTHDLGEPYLYEFSFEISADEKIIDQSSILTGLREIKLVQEDDAQGTSFNFVLNGVPLFIKGANHIPLDMFLTNISDQRYIDEIDSAIESNMNLIRVWGGGIYEADIFYVYCDRKGVLVWQDFMFACSMYPIDDQFFQNVRIEVIENIRRLRNHPCIALWCGNNEMDVMWKEYHFIPSAWKNQYNESEQKLIWSAYERIFNQMIPYELARLHPEVSYWPSSPLAQLSNDENQHASLKLCRGDIHYWNVWHSHAPIEDYQQAVGRFMSEYGFQSFPQVESFQKISVEALDIGSPIVFSHQKDKAGNAHLLYYLDQHYPEIERANFDEMVYLSQQLQAYAMETAIKAHRTAKPYCMGTLYWQLNDAWPGASWSTIDYYGNWKAAQYAVKKAYQDPILSTVVNKDVLSIYGISDQKSFERCSLRINILSYQNDEKTVTLTNEFAIGTSKAELLTEIDLKTIEVSQKYLYIELIDEHRNVLADVVHHFETFKQIKLAKPDIRSEYVREGERIVWTFSSDFYAKGVELKTSAIGHFEENYFNLIPEIPRRVSFILKEDLAENQVVPNIFIKSLVDYLPISRQ